MHKTDLIKQVEEIKLLSNKELSLMSENFIEQSKQHAFDKVL